MDPQNHFAAIDAVIEAWKRSDVEAVLEQVAEDVEFTYAIGKRPVKGKDRLRRLLEALAKQQSKVGWRIVQRAQAGDTVFVEGIDDYVNGSGHRILNPYVSIYEFEGDKIRVWRDYYDGATLERAEAGEPVSEWLAPLVSDTRGQA